MRKRNVQPFQSYSTMMSLFNPLNSCESISAWTERVDQKQKSLAGCTLPSHVISGIKRADMKVTCLVWCPTFFLFFFNSPFNLMKSIPARCVGSEDDRFPAKSHVFSFSQGKHTHTCTDKHIHTYLQFSVAVTY